MFDRSSSVACDRALSLQFFFLLPSMPHLERLTNQLNNSFNVKKYYFLAYLDSSFCFRIK